MPSVLQILICPAEDYSLSDSCPVSVEKISWRLEYSIFLGTWTDMPDHSADPDNMQQNAMSDQGIHYLSFIQQILDAETDSKMDTTAYLQITLNPNPAEPGFCLCWGFTAQSTQWGHVEHGQFT